MPALDILKKFAVNLGVGAAVQIVRGWFNEQLKDVTPSGLYEAILDNRDLWSVTPENVKDAGGKFKGTYRNILAKYDGEITTELLLKWMKKDHPELYSTIINTNIDGNPAGIIWFDEQVRRIKQKIREM